MDDSAHKSTARDASTILLAIVAFALCSITAAVKSKGFLESDGGTHYIFARHAFQQPAYFVDVWGRPLCTMLFAGPAAIGGLIGVRLTSLAVAIGCALVAYRIAVVQEYRWPVLALIFTLGQPLVFLHSFAELTELPFALVIGVALLAYQTRRWSAMAILLTIAPLGRPEGFVFLLLGAFALAAHQQLKWIAVLPVGLILWSLAGHQLAGPADSPWWRWLPQHWPYETGSEYPSGSPIHFLLMLPVLIGPFAFPAMWIGMENNLRVPGGIRALLRDHRKRVDWLIAALPLAILAGHSVLYALGRMSSNGELRYLLIAAPMWGLLCARGWAWIFTRLRWSRAVSWAALAAVLPGLVNFYWRVIPIEPSAGWQQAQRVVAWYKASGLREKYPRVLTNHPGVFYYMDVSPSDRRFVEPWSTEAVAHPPAGVLLLWDSEYCLRNADARFVVPLARVEEGGWVNDWIAQWKSSVDSSQPGASQWHLFCSPVDARGNVTRSVTRVRGSNTWHETAGNPPGTFGNGDF